MNDQCPDSWNPMFLIVHRSLQVSNISVFFGHWNVPHRNPMEPCPARISWTSWSDCPSPAPVCSEVSGFLAGKVKRNLPECLGVKPEKSRDSNPTYETLLRIYKSCGLNLKTTCLHLRLWFLPGKQGLTLNRLKISRIKNCDSPPLRTICWWRICCAKFTNFWWAVRTKPLGG